MFRQRQQDLTVGASGERCVSSELRISARGLLLEDWAKARLEWCWNFFWNSVASILRTPGFC
jgi:hypothetical protein